jgi:hypothetical protein
MTIMAMVIMRMGMGIMALMGMMKLYVLLLWKT